MDRTVTYLRLQYNVRVNNIYMSLHAFRSYKKNSVSARFNSL